MNDAEPNAHFRRVTFDVRGGRMAGIAFGPETPNPDVVFLHATGFNARTYRTLLAPLGDRYHVLALDARGHGRTQLPAGTFGYTSWKRHRDDVLAVLEQHMSAPVVLSGHSMGGMVSLLAAARRPDLVSGLALFEPVFLPAALYAWIEMPGGPLLARQTWPIVRGAGRRRKRFDDRESAVRALTGRGVFKAFPSDALEDYVADGLVEDRRGGLKLACAPSYEAATYVAQRNNPWQALRRVDCPLVVLRAERESTTAAAAAHRIAALKPEARVVVVEGAGHMLPLERPDRARAAIETAMLLAGRSGLELIE